MQVFDEIKKKKKTIQPQHYPVLDDKSTRATFYEKRLLDNEHLQRLRSATTIKMFQTLSFVNLLILG